MHLQQQVGARGYQSAAVVLESIGLSSRREATNAKASTIVVSAVVFSLVGRTLEIGNDVMQNLSVTGQKLDTAHPNILVEIQFNRHIAIVNHAGGWNCLWGNV